MPGRLSGVSVLEPEFHPDVAQYREYLRFIAESRSIRGLAGKIDASDVVQESLLRAHRARDQFDGQSEPEYRAWLQTILTNVVAENARRFMTGKRDINMERPLNKAVNDSSRRLDKLLHLTQTTPSARLRCAEQIRRLVAELNSLPADQREAIRLHHLEGMTVEEVAQRTQRSKPSVAGHLRRGLKTLRARLGSGSRSEGC